MVSIHHIIPVFSISDTQQSFKDLHWGDLIMGEIIRTTSGIRIHPYYPRMSSEIETFTSVFNKATHKRDPFSGFIDIDSESFLVHKNIGDKLLSRNFGNYDDIVIPPTKGQVINPPLEFKENFMLKPEQTSMLGQMIKLPQYEMFVNLPTAVGKTILGLAYIASMGIKSIIICFSSKILAQWRETIIDKMNLDQSRIKIVGKGEYITKVINGEINVSGIDIFLTTPALLSMYGNKHGWMSIKAFFDRCNVGMKIVDEAHRNIGSTVKINAVTSLFKTVYLSADFNKASRYTRDQFFQIFYKVPILRVSSDDMVKLKHLSVMSLSYRSHPSTEDILRITNVGAYKWNIWEYCKYQFADKELINMLIMICSKIIEKQIMTNKGFYKILIMVAMIQHVDIICNIIKGEFPNRTVGRYHSDMPDDEKESSKVCDIIVSTYGSLSTGTDIVLPNIQHVISTVPVDVVTHNQTAGRCRPIDNEQSVYWMLHDDDFEYCRNNAVHAEEYLKYSRVKTIFHTSMSGGTNT